MGVTATFPATWYRVFDTSIEAVTAVKATDASVWVVRSGGYDTMPRMERRRSSYFTYTPDFEEARTLVIKKLQEEIKRYSKQYTELPKMIQNVESRIIRMSAMKPPTIPAPAKPITKEQL